VFGASELSSVFKLGFLLGVSLFLEPEVEEGKVRQNGGNRSARQINNSRGTQLVHVLPL
jgi:hypothetical protein